MPTARAPAQSWRTRPAKPAAPRRGSSKKRGRHCCRPLSPDLDPLGGLLATLPAPSGFGGSRHPRRDATPGLAFGRQERAGSREPWRPASWWPARRSTASPAMLSASFLATVCPCRGACPSVRCQRRIASFRRTSDPRRRGSACRVSPRAELARGSVGSPLPCLRRSTSLVSRRHHGRLCDISA